MGSKSMRPELLSALLAVSADAVIEPQDQAIKAGDIIASNSDVSQNIRGQNANADEIPEEDDEPNTVIDINRGDIDITRNSQPEAKAPSPSHALQIARPQKSDLSYTKIGVQLASSSSPEHKARKIIPSPLKQGIEPSSGAALLLDDNEFIAMPEAKRVDKSLLVKEILDYKSQVKLIARPSCFGKSVNLDMLSFFFDQAISNDKRQLFHSMKIWSVNDGAYQQYQGQNPVIFLTLSHIQANDFEEALQQFRDLMIRQYEFQCKRYKLKRSAQMEKILDPKGKISDIAMQSLLKKLMGLLHEQCKKKVVLLIDEYDTPLTTAYIKTPQDQLKDPNSYYQSLVKFFRYMLGQALKGNEHLLHAVLTGTIRISKEGIFSGPNNIKLYCITDRIYSEHFGFSEEEVRTLLTRAFGPIVNEDLMAQVKAHYGGYQIGKNKVFNSRSIIKFMEDNRGCKRAEDFSYRNYWINQPNQQLITTLIKQSDEANKRELKSLVDGGSITKTIDEHIVLGDLNLDKEIIWSYLLLSGYLTISASEGERLSPREYKLIIPNQEVREFYTRFVKDELVFEPGELKQLAQEMKMDVKASPPGGGHAYASASSEVRPHSDVSPPLIVSSLHREEQHQVEARGNSLQVLQKKDEEPEVVYVHLPNRRSKKQYKQSNNVREKPFSPSFWSSGPDFSQPPGNKAAESVSDRVLDEDNMAEQGRSPTQDHEAIARSKLDFYRLQDAKQGSLIGTPRIAFDIEPPLSSTPAQEVSGILQSIQLEDGGRIAQAKHESEDEQSAPQSPLGSS